MDPFPLMTAVQAVVLGAVQGLTEFLPISSSAHLILMPWLLGWPDQGLTFDVMLHAGTLIAILSFFWREWMGMISGVMGRNRQEPEGSRGLLLLIICGTAPAAVAGFLAQEVVETQLRSPLVLAATLIGLAVVLWVAERVARLKRGMQEINLGDVVVIGVAQALALIPGTSRSGITITAGLFRDLTREAAARFSFLLSAPIIAGAGLKKLLDLRHTGIAEPERLPMLLGFLTSLLVGYLTIKFLLRFLQSNTLHVFIYYRIFLGILILALIQFAGFRP